MKILSLKKNSHFRLVYSRGRSMANRLLVMYVFKNRKGTHPAAPRLGLSVSRKVGGAVTRNKIRRRIKEAFRLMAKAGDFAPGDMIVIARQAAAAAPYAELAESAMKLARKHGMLAAPSAAPDGEI